ncbi:hypothetical protein, partial [Microseira wollei]|uniref:hypothetical protein n=1 Tax=Microseira wollei TaxID=467598 RepID=UPI001CFCBF2E
SEIFWENANLMIAVSPGRNLVDKIGNIPQTNRVYLKNRPACRHKASEIFWKNANLMIAVSPGRNKVDKIGNIPQTNRVYLKNRLAF